MAHSSPLAHDPLLVLLDHNYWATRRVLEACMHIAPAQMHQRFEIGLGTLHDTITHIIGAMRRWADRIDERPVRASIEARSTTDPVPTPVGRSVRELMDLLDDAAADLRAVATRHAGHGLAHTITTQFGGKAYHFSRGAALVHVTTHGVHHRAQCINMLRHLKVPGVSDHLPEIAVTEWQAETQTGEVAAWSPRK